MNLRAIFKIASSVLLVFGVSLAASCAVGWGMGDLPDARNALALSALVCLAPGLALRFALRKLQDASLSPRDGFVIVTVAWVLAGLVGALPYLLAGTIPTFSAAVFESVSGFSTTGASVLAVLETVPRGILFWRSTTHFLGGMGILLLCIAILPSLGTGGLQLYRAEVAGPTKDRLTPRLRDTARLLFGVYVLLCAAAAGLLMLGGMSLFDAVCHAFGAVATGGFSTRTASVAAYGSLYIELVIVTFMILGATNFVLHLNLLSGRGLKDYARDTEFRLFIGVWMAAVVAVAVNVTCARAEPFGQALRDSLFSVTSLLATAGFCTADFDRWPGFSRFILLLVMILGGCAGSTAGGIKQFRVAVIAKSIARRIKSLFHRQAVFSVKMNGEAVSESVISGILIFGLLYLAILALASAFMSLFTVDLATAVSSVIATTGGVGPGLSQVGPTQNYGALPAAGQWVLIVCMLAGRLEFYALFALFFPSFWRR